MRKEIENWWAQANRDFITAQNSLKSGDYYASVFWCQQSVEKALKAIFILVKNESAFTTHSLIYLATELKVDKSFFPFLRELTPGYVNTRYPDVADTIPSEMYDEQRASELLMKAGNLLQWLEKKFQIKKR